MLDRLGQPRVALGQRWPLGADIQPGVSGCLFLMPKEISPGLAGSGENSHMRKVSEGEEGSRDDG